MASHRYTVSLVVTGRVATEVDGMRRALGARSLHRIPPHMTLVPPVNVPEDATHRAFDVLRAAAAASPPIVVGIGPPATFFPANPTVYLAVDGDLAALERLRGLLSVAPLAPPPHRRERPFVPHVTLDQPASPERIAPALTVLADYREQVVFEEVTLLEQDAAHVWHPVAAAPLAVPAVVSRGGLEVSLAATERLDPAERQWAADRCGRSTAEAPFAVTARREGSLVGVVTGVVSAGVCEVARLVVDPACRHQGVGGQLLRAVEDLAAEGGCEVVRATVDSGSAAEQLLTGRGYRLQARLAGRPPASLLERGPRDARGSRP